jgi:hypothetical protein
MKKIIFLSFCLFALLLFTQINVFACDCGSRTVADELKHSTEVFSGKIIAQEYQKINDTSDEDFGAEVLFIKIKVDRWWKGNGNSEVVLRSLDAKWASKYRKNGCTFDFTTNDSYLIYANNYKNSLVTNLCKRTNKLPQAGEDLKQLGEGFLPKTEQKCPSLYIVFPNGVSSSKDRIVFSIQVGNAKQKQKLTYKWTVRDSGKIESGQGTPSITVIKGDSGKGITVSVEVGGLEEGCSNKVEGQIIS